MKKKAKNLIFITLSSLIVISSFSTNVQVDGGLPTANLVLKTNGGGVRPDYGLYIAQYLRNIGIEVEVKVEEWAVFVGALLLTHDYDIGIVALTPDFPTPDSRRTYTTDGDLNMFDLGPDIPYNNKSEALQYNASIETDLRVCQQLYYDWQQLLMDKICPMLPLFTSKNYNAYWSNIIDGHEGWGTIYNLPYFNYDGYHDGQVSLDEANLIGDDYTDLNPLFITENNDWFTWWLLSESAIVVHDGKPMINGIINDWEQINNTYYTLTMRDDVYWNPSYNITERSINSDPLDTIPTGELMTGLKNGEYSDGTNQQVTAKDAVFSLLAHAYEEIGKDWFAYQWIKACYVDPVDPMTFHLVIDQNPETPENEPKSDFWYFLNLDLLPEFFLNSTDPTVIYTNGGARCTGLYPEIIDTSEWASFSFSAFGCGMYMLDYYSKGSTIVLERSPYWFGVGAIDGQEDMTPFVKNINLRIIGDSSSQKFEFLAGRLESCSFDKRTFTQLQGDPRFILGSGSGGNVIFMFYNLRRPFIGGADNYEFLTVPGKEEYTKACAVRKAMNYAINREEMNEVVNLGDFLIVDCPIVSSFSYYYYNDIIKYDYDICASYEWLGAAGYPTGICPNICTNGTCTTTTPDITGSSPLLIILMTISLSILFTYSIRRRKK